MLKSLGQINYELAQIKGVNQPQNHLITAKEVLQKSSAILTNLKTQNAFGEYDKKLFIEVEALLENVDKMWR